MTAAREVAVPSRVDVKLLQKAVQALLKYHDATKNTKSLLGDDSVVHVQFGLDKVPHQSSPKPRRVDIPHALWKTSDDDNDEGIQEPSVCLIVKEESKEWVQELITAFPKEMGFVKKVLGLDSLRKKHAKFEQQRALLHRFDVFMADDRILPMLAKALGKHFFETKKQPIPLNLTRKSALPVVILQSLRSTFWFLSEGTCLTVKAGMTGMSDKQIAENVVAICSQVPTKIPRKWANVRSISLKTATSMSLPFYNKTPAELKEIAKMAGIEDEEYIDNEPPASNEEEDVEKVTAKKRRVAKSPLIRALQKQQEEEASKQNKMKKSDEVKPKKRKELADDDEKSASPKTKARKIDGDSSPNTEKKPKAVKQNLDTPNNKVKSKDDVLVESKKRGVDDGSSAKKRAKTQSEAETPKAKSSATEVKSDTIVSKKSMMVTPKSKSPVTAVNKSDTSLSKKPIAETPKTKSRTTEVKKSVTSSSKKSMVETPKEKIPVTTLKTSDTIASKKKAAPPAKEDTSKATKGTSKTNEPFIASKKYSGSKSGYVFKMGNKGVGYYVDLKPKVDPVLIETMLRSLKQKGRGGGNSGRQPKGKGRGRR